MEGEYGDLRQQQYIEGRPFLFPTMISHQPYDMQLMFPSATPSNDALAFEAAGRWPRQETLALLEIRSRLDPKFKEAANHKAPLWDEVSRIMSEENGYQRSGKKCREKFENLCKYYKKTKEGRAGRQDGKHYRFFRQLEALYGETSSNSFPHLHFPNSLPSDQEDIITPDSCDYYATSSYGSDSNIPPLDSREKKKRRGKRISLKAKIEESINAQMKSMIEKQEVWMEKMTMVIESKERERLMREEQWRKQDEARIEREHEMWASERAWIEARDAALMDAFNKLAGDGNEVRSGMHLMFQQNGINSEQAIIAGCNGLMCREKWDQIINDYLMNCSKKRKENYSNHQVGGVEAANAMEINGYGNQPMNEGLSTYFVGDSYQRL